MRIDRERKGGKIGNPNRRIEQNQRTGEKRIPIDRGEGKEEEYEVESKVWREDRDEIGIVRFGRKEKDEGKKLLGFAFLYTSVRGWKPASNHRPERPFSHTRTWANYKMTLGFDCPQLLVVFMGRPDPARPPLDRIWALFFGP